jgi:hypothetical protein
MGTGVTPDAARIKVKGVMEIGSIALLKVALMLAFRATPVALFNGVTELTVGAAASGAELEVKLHENSLASAFPSTSFTPVVTVAVYTKPDVRLAAG